MLKDFTDIAVMVLAISLVVTLVKNPKGTQTLIGSSTSGFASIVKAANQSK